MKKYHIPMTLFVLFTFFGFTSIVDAHVTVWPKESTVGAYEKYTVRVPSEKDSSTTKVQLEFPKDVQVETVEPVSGWNYQFVKGSDGRNTGIIWTATGDGIKAHEFFEFPFIGANPKQATSVSWKAHQTYADGTVVDWTGAPESETPASVTTISPKSEMNEMDHTMNMNPQTPDKSSSSYQWIAIILAVLSLLLSLISLFRKRT
ncbi:YcnI family protein [Shimazuella sp. AN120528]|uniref:YcnI family copper-binding membrane protein n=1 Tax=Shimazuella soli TaxID=1892854 RepID=UPI001F0DCAC6|nr:YcnI family protein [Shimazuella soli]MCH5585776.1 YcnI family protein [Shimazuella soli]